MRETARARGCTLVEGLLAASLAALTIALFQGLLAGAWRGSARACEVGDAVRSVAIASELMRSNLDRMLYQDAERDLSIAPDGHRFSMRVPVGPEPNLLQASSERRSVSQ